VHKKQRPARETFVAEQITKQLYVLSKLHRAEQQVARWYIFKPKILILVNFYGASNGRGWFILWPFKDIFGFFPGDRDALWRSADF
jgi:hypothetical protein